MSNTPLQQTPEGKHGPLDGFLCFSVYSTGLAFNRIYKPLLDRLGLTYVQYLVMVALAAKDDQTVSELGDQMFLESNTLTPLLKRLEAGGLVSRTRDKNDERVVRIRLTDKGQDVARDARCVPAEVLAMTGLSVDQMAALQDALSNLRATLRASEGS